MQKSMDHLPVRTVVTESSGVYIFTIIMFMMPGVLQGFDESLNLSLQLCPLPAGVHSLTLR